MPGHNIVFVHQGGHLEFQNGVIRIRSLHKWTLFGMIILIVMVFIIFLWNEITSSNTRKLIVIINDGKDVENCNLTA